MLNLVTLRQKGMIDETFDVAADCTRGEIVTFLHRAYVEEARLTVEK